MKFMRNFVTLTTYTLANDAHLAKSVLESADIPVFLKDELTVQVHNFYSNAIGGVKLQVPESYSQKALEILTEGGFIEKKDNNKLQIFKLTTDKKNAICPFCKSKNIKEIKNGSFLEKITFGFLKKFSPVENFNFRCNNCKSEWIFEKK